MPRADAPAAGAAACPRSDATLIATRRPPISRCSFCCCWFWGCGGCCRRRALAGEEAAAAAAAAPDGVGRGARARHGAAAPRAPQPGARKALLIVQPPASTGRCQRGRCLSFSSLFLSFFCQQRASLEDLAGAARGGWDEWKDASGVGKAGLPQRRKRPGLWPRRRGISTRSYPGSSRWRRRESSKALSFCCYVVARLRSRLENRVRPRAQRTCSFSLAQQACASAMSTPSPCRDMPH
eukprot:366062-Chlamydomonas_euryale.AAC.3